MTKKLKYLTFDLVRNIYFNYKSYADDELVDDYQILFKLSRILTPLDYDKFENLFLSSKLTITEEELVDVFGDD